LLKIIAIVGSPDSGKTTVALSLAAKFAIAGKETIVLCADHIVPAIPAAFPRTTTAVGAPVDKIHSIGKITKIVEISEKDILDELVSIPNFKHLGFLGYAYGENSGSYPPLYATDIGNIFKAASKICECIIVDCVSNFAEDTISTTALTSADRVICIGGCRYKDIVYYASQFGLLAQTIYGQNDEKNKKFKDQIFVLNKVSPYDGITEIDKFYPHIDVVIPYEKGIKEQTFEGTLLLKRPPKKFENGVGKLYEELTKVAK
jgi:cellulose biosynthesis protein BcsQ